MRLKSFSKAALLVGALANLTACMSTTAMVSEAAWQTLNVVDTGQTITTARNPQAWYEINPIIGPHPSQERVYFDMVGGAVLHYAGTALLDHMDPGSGPWHTLSLAWQSTNLVAKGYFVGKNFAYGEGPWAGGPPAPRKVVPLPVMR